MGIRTVKGKANKARGVQKGFPLENGPREEKGGGVPFQRDGRGLSRRKVQGIQAKGSSKGRGGKKRKGGAFMKKKIQP